MSDEIPPFGAENLPFKEIPVQPAAAPALGARNNKFLILALFLIIIILALGIILILWQQKQRPPTLVSPSPSVALPVPSLVATASAVPNNLEERLSSLETKLKNIDLQQTEYVFPILDFSFNLEK